MRRKKRGREKDGLIMLIPKCLFLLQSCCCFTDLFIYLWFWSYASHCGDPCWRFTVEFTDNVAFLTTLSLISSVQFASIFFHVTCAIFRGDFKAWIELQGVYRATGFQNLSSNVFSRYLRYSGNNKSLGKHWELIEESDRLARPSPVSHILATF